MYDRRAMNDAAKTASRLVNYKVDHLEKSVKEINRDDKKYFILDANYDIDTVMKKLSYIDGNIYYVKGDKNIIIPSTSIQIKSFNHLRRYIKTVLNLELKITENIFDKSLPKIVELQNDDRTQLSLQNVFLKLSRTTTIQDLIEYINRTTDYTIFIDKQSFMGEKNINTGKNIRLSNNNVLGYELEVDNWSLSKFVKYLRSSLNLYVDVDYNNKSITISKYKVHIFRITAPNIKIAYGATLQKTIGGSSVRSSVKLYDVIKLKIKGLLESFQEPSINVQIDDVTGSLVVKSSSKALKAISKVVNEFNNELNKQVYLRISHYDIILKKENTFGVDFSQTQKVGTNLRNRFVKNNFLFKSVNDSSYAFFLESIHKYGYLYNMNEYNIILTNNIPYEDNDLITTKYIKSKKTTSTITNGVSKATEDYETDEYKEGYAINFLAKIRNNNSASIKMNITEKKLENLGTKVYGENADSFTLPSIRDVAKSPLVRLHSGERIIVWQRKYLDIADNYSGTIPIEDFVVGGTSGKNYVLKEYLLFVELVRIKK
ncbi:hypothetical protein MNB_ARC-1_1133 [hydrothermal vent metagenome]|uniref:Uncharacterized protein n=1 Tax=hydrothermal vent metagenome TaxID=652676 RepID=A0A3B1EAB7_9ZZZZ